MKRPVREPGRQISFVVDEEDNKNYLGLMKIKIDSETGRKNYARQQFRVYRY